MKVGIIFFALVLHVGLSSARAEDTAAGKASPGTLAPHPSMTENSNGDMKQGEYEVVSLNGSITRSFCPYTCEMRGLPKESCRTWPSNREKDKCYIQDTRLPSDAIAFGGPK